MDFRQGAARGRDVASAVFREIRAEKITFMAGSIAYHAFLSLLPFLLLVLFVVSRVGDEELAADLVRAMAGYLTPEIQADLVQAALSAGSDGLSLVGIIVLVWGTLRIFRGLDTAFSDIYESESENTFFDQVVDGVVVFGAVGVAIFAVAVAEELVGLPSFGAADSVLRPLGTVLTLALAFLPMYYVFPDESGVTVREVIPGALVAATGWTLLSLGFGFYVERTSATEYGLVGAVILLVTWLYFGGMILLVGASLNAVLAGRSEDVRDIAWGEHPDADPDHNDAAFVEPVRELGAALEGRLTELTVRTGDREFTLPAPDEATVTVDTVERPAVLGGNRETAEVRLRWDSWED
jgi:membrane protein